MAEREAQRGRELYPMEAPFYEWVYAQWNLWKERANLGEVVIRGKAIGFQQSRQGRSKYYLHPLKEELVTQSWLFFMQDIRTHSGRHRHQGGLAIYVLEGKGWTTVDGVRHDWEEGDLILLPVKPQGVEHQHFNAVPGNPCRCVAMIYLPFIESMSSELQQKELHPEWAGHA